ncbi:hypothetical protein VPH35_037090 [Triticum aestivum]
MKNQDRKYEGGCGLVSAHVQFALGSEAVLIMKWNFLLKSWLCSSFGGASVCSSTIFIRIIFLEIICSALSKKEKEHHCSLEVQFVVLRNAVVHSFLKAMAKK